MSKDHAVTSVTSLIEAISIYKNVISDAYYKGSIIVDESNEKGVGRLRHLRVLTADVGDSFRLKPAFRQFVDLSLNQSRLFSMGANIGGLFERFDQLISSYLIVFEIGKDADIKRYEEDIKDSISDIASAIDDELIDLNRKVSTRFADVTTLAAKQKENTYYLGRTKLVLDVLQAFHFSSVGDSLVSHEDIYLAYRELLANRMPAFREALSSVYEVLSQYLFEFRKIEERTKKIRSFSEFMKSNPDWIIADWDEAADTAEWLNRAAPLKLRANPDVLFARDDEVLSKIAQSITTQAHQGQTSRRVDGVIHADKEIVIVASPPEIRRATTIYFSKAKSSDQGISARTWWVENSAILKDVSEEGWLLRVLNEYSKQKKKGLWRMRLVQRQDDLFTGNVLINDVIVFKGRTNA